jgi:hypothetical protein
MGPTIKVAVAVSTKAPLVPEIVMGYEPFAALELTFIVTMLEPGAAVGGLNTEVTPAGSPEAEKVIFPVNPAPAVVTSE